MARRTTASAVFAFAFLALIHASPSRAACSTAGATLLQPANNASTSVPITFSWASVAGAAGYNLYALGGGSTTPALLGSTIDTKFTVPSLPTGPIQWFVRTLYDGCPAVDSSKFTLTITAAASCPTAMTILRAPADNAANVANPVTFDWDDVPGAESYAVWISVNGSDPAVIARVPDSRLITNVPAGAVTWFVETLFPNCPSTRSNIFHFTTVPACPDAPVPPQTIAPADGAATVTSPVTFQWTAVPGATAYRVWSSQNGGDPVLLGTTQSTQLTAPLTAGKFAWAVVAIFGDGCPTAVSKYAAFTVTSGSSCGGTAPLLTAPANGASTNAAPVTFRWVAATNAVSYDLFVSAAGGPFDLLAHVLETTVSRIVPVGPVSWYVVANFAGCPAQQSPTFSFTATDATQCGTGAITLTTPPNGSSQSTPVTFTWSSVTGATGYRLWVGVNGEPPGLIAKPSAATASLPLPSGAIEWYVEALFNNCPSVVSPHGTFTVLKSSTCGTATPPTLQSPVGTAVQPATTSTSVTFKWNAVQGASTYIVWIAAANQPYADVALTKETSATRELPQASFSWFVEALFDGCPSARSGLAYFNVQSSTPRCSTESPTLLQPADGAKSSSPVTFLWTNVAGADTYRLFGQVVGSSDPPGLIAVTPDTTVTLSLPPGTIKWHVEASFPTCPATRSSASVLTVPKAANCADQPPQLVSPANGSTVSKLPVNFAWNLVSGASRYVLIIRNGEGAPTPIAEIPDTSVTRYVPEGVTEWWVVAFVAGCGTQESSHFTFTVPDSNCVKLKPVVLAPPDGAELLSPAAFEWTPVPRAKDYRIWSVDDSGSNLLATTTKTEALVKLPSGELDWFVEATFDSCPPTRSPVSHLKVLKAAPACHTPDSPHAMAPGQIASGTTYKVRWTVIPNSDRYELQESTAATFAGATTEVISGISASFTHTAADKPVPYFYRVRAISSCSDDRGGYSEVITVFVVPPKPPGQQSHVAGEFGGQGPITQTRFIPGSSTPISFTARTDKSWLTVTPASGTIPTTGTTITLTADPTALPPGTNTATVQLSYGAGKTGSLATTTSVPVSVSLVSPVTPAGKNTPLPDSLIIPAVAHAQGQNDSMFESDVRVANISAQPMKYQVNFTPSGKDGTQSGSSTTIQVDAGSSMALDDILSSFFGTGTDGSSATGMVEIRPVTSTSTTSTLTSTSSSAGTQLTSVASSRTFNVTSNGTFGQYIPAIPYSQFIGKSTSTSPAVLSLQQIAQSSAYRTNFGLVEGSGEAATVMLSVFDNTGLKVADIPQALLPGEHLQINQILAVNNISLQDGRIEVTVVSDTGRVTAYASTVDNKTNDPLLVSPVLKSSVSSTRYVIPGIADLNTGIANWRSDVRVFNAGSSDVSATVTYSPQTGNAGASAPLNVTIKAGEVKALDNVLASQFGVTNSGGSLVITTTSSSSLVATARTYNQTSNGTYGQFIPGVTPQESVAAGGRALQLLQLEQSSRMRTNIGLAETSGNPATVEVGLVLPDSTSTAKTSFSLAANEFRQFSLGEFGVSNAYNARVTVKVTGGSGKVTAYGSVIDQVTQDPTYVPAQ